MSVDLFIAGLLGVSLVAVLILALSVLKDLAAEGDRMRTGRGRGKPDVAPRNTKPTRK